MKTRAEIYSKEAADILRNITTYHYMRHDQLLRLYPGKEEKIDNLLSFFLRQGRIFRDEHSGLYHDGTEAHADKEMLAALWVLTDFIDRVDYHSSTDFPVKLIFIADGELYEVIYVETGGEALIEHAVAKQPDDAEKRIVIVESAEQIGKLNIPDVTAYCTVDMNTGAVQYYRTSISRRIGSIKGDIEKLSNTLCAIEKTDIENYPDNYAMLTTDAALRSELIACRMRHLLYGSTATRKETYLASAGVVQGIRIKAQENMLEITLPCLLPKRKQRQSTEFLIDPLYFTLSQYSDNNELPKFRQCVVCFSHIYSEKFHNRRVRDYDNLELKQLLDVLSTFIMVDDTGLLVDAYNTTEIGEADCTRISVMAKEDFPKWLNEREKSLKTISDF